MLWSRRRENQEVPPQDLGAVAAAALPVQTGSQPLRTGPQPVKDRLRWAPTREHASMFLTWLQQPGGLTGWVLQQELELAYRDMAIELALEPRGWTAIGRELRKLLGQPKHMTEGPNARRVYWIPATGLEVATVAGQRRARRAV